VGIDLGTQGVRGLVVDDDGQVLAVAERPLTSRTGEIDGRRTHEQDPEQWWSATAEVLSELVGTLREQDGPGSQIAGIACDATSGSFLLADPSGRPLTAGLMYDDARGAGELDDVRAAGQALWQQLGLSVQGSWALPRMVWLARQGRWPSGARLLHQGDLVVERLVGHPVATDTSQALKTGVDLQSVAWPDDVLASLDVPVESLPSVVLPGAPLGTVSRAASELTGLAVGTPVLAGCTDGCAAQLGAGAVEPGQWNAVLGTTLVLKGVTEELLHDPTGALYSHRSPDGGWWPGGASSTGAAAVRDLFGRADLGALTRAAARLDLADVPVAYPLTSRGERFPFVAPAAEGFALVGAQAPTPLSRLTAVRDDATAFAAVALGVASIERLCVDLLDLSGAPVDSVAMTGGGARNLWWTQLRCDLLGVPVHLPERAESALGAAVLAAAGRGTGGLAGAARRLVRRRAVLEPDAARGPQLLAAHVALVEALSSRGWLDERLTQHALTRSTA
jgi:sugar (pentulose or hexulose) kinase